MDWNAYGLLLIAILLGVVGQLLLKRGMSQHPDFQVAQLLTLIGDPFVIGGFASYGFSTLLYFKVLASLDLSLAYPTVSLSYVLVILASKMLFKEQVSIARWLAVIVICIGVGLVGLGS